MGSKKYRVARRKKKFVLYKEYAAASIDEIFSHDQLYEAKKWRIEALQSSYIEKLGNENFAIRPLPPEAQFSKVNGILSGDFDKDGHKDILSPEITLAIECNMARRMQAMDYC